MSQKMKCRKHITDYTSSIGVCATCLRHRKTFAMICNEEKAQSMLNRFITMKADEKKKPKERRPFLASEYRDLAEADKWRQQIMREIDRKVAEIQNEAAGKKITKN